MIITFAGHSKVSISNELRKRIRETIEESIVSERIMFYCGGYGVFDNTCAQIVGELRDTFPNIESIFVTPYRDSTRLAMIEESRLYDGILYPDIENVPYRFAISKRNEFMVDKADLLIAYVNAGFGGAYKTLVYARRKKKRIINLAEGIV